MEETKTNPPEANRLKKEKRNEPKRSESKREEAMHGLAKASRAITSKPIMRKKVDNLWEVCRAVGNTPRGRFYDIVGGYTLATDDGLKKLNTALSELDREAVKNELKVGVHSDCQVTSTNWGRHAVNDPAHTVTQVFCSACSVAYSHNPGELWAPFASLS